MKNAIVEYFAEKNMGSKFLKVVSVMWEDLDTIEKEMVKSLKEAGGLSALHIRSKLTQEELDTQIAATQFIAC